MLQRFHIAQMLSSPTATLVQTGDSTTCLTSSSPTWIIDSEASDHMSGDKDIVSSWFYMLFSLCYISWWFIGSTFSVQCINTNSIFSLSPSSGLYVPNFPFNLLSVSEITRALNCSIKFYLTFSEFQGLDEKDDWHRSRERRDVLPGLGLQFTFWSLLSIRSSLSISFKSFDSWV